MDTADKLKTWLSNDWDSSNTDGDTPIFKEITNAKRVKQLTKNNDVVLTQDRNQPDSKASVGYDVVNRTWNATIDIRTVKTSHNHLIKMKDEVERILYKHKKDDSDNDYQYLKIERNEDMSNKNYDLYRRVIDVSLHKNGVSI